MSRFFTWRRLFLYSAYFIAVFSIIISLFISEHAWNLQKTVRLIEKSWDTRGTNYSEYGWIDKAAHAIFAGHEDVSQYNDLFWVKYHELDESEDGSFRREDLETCEPGYEPEWVTANAGYDKWGFVMYRTDYDEDDETWTKSVRHINHTIRTHLELEATHEGKDCDPNLVRDHAVLEIIEDKENLENAPAQTIRAMWRQRVDDGLVENGFKMGGWQHGWYRLRLNGETTGTAEPNGLALNLCLMYDWHARSSMMLASSGLPATGPRDPWEPFLVAVDGMWSKDGYMYLTSWAHEYAGVYGVALSLLFTDFHGKTFEREMERSAPRMFMGGPIVDATAPWWQKLFQVLLSTFPAVARPGHFPFHDRIQEMDYPFVREDSHWQKPGNQESDEPEHDAAQTRMSLDDLLAPRDPLFYIPCLKSDEDQEGCFQLGNFRVRKPKTTSTASETISSASNDAEPKRHQ